MQYSFGFSEELQQDWRWSELFSAQPEILSYANHVADRFDLRRFITFNARVKTAIFDETSARWMAHTSTGETVIARYVVMATRRGVIKKTDLSDFEKIRVTGIIGLVLDEGDEIISIDGVQGDVTRLSDQIKTHTCAAKKATAG